MPETLKQTQLFRFDQMAVQVKDKIDNPAEADVDRYVGLEHIDPESLKIRRWGETTDVESSKIIFKSGDIIFGKRRAYQRKLAVADFDGICSAHAMVLRPKTHVVLEEFLPFFMQSDIFMDRAVKISVGGLSPTINWSDIAKEEFALPLLEEQRRITDAFVAARNLQETYFRSLESLRQVKMRFVLDTFKSALRSAKLCRMSDIAELKMGRQKAPKYAKGVGLRPFLSVANVGELELVLGSVEKMDFTDTEFERFRLIPGDILITEGDLVSRFNVGRAAVFKGEILDCCFQNTLIRLRPRKGLDVDYALLMLEGARLSGVFARAAKTTTVTHLGLGRLNEVTLPLPALPKQLEAGNQLNALLESRTGLRERLSDAARVLSQLSQEVFG